MIQCDYDFIDPVDLKVIATQASFDGYYTVDGGDINYFTGGILTNGISSYEVTIDSMQTLELQLTTRTGSNSITIQVYRNENKVKELVQSDLNQPTTVNFTYQYGEENNTTTP